MNDPGRDEAFARRAGEVLGESVGVLDARTLSRLTRARHAAVGAAGASAARRWLPRWQALVPAGAVGAAVMALLLVVGQPPPPATLRTANLHGEDLELLADRDGLALAQDDESGDGEPDYAFYDWAVDAAQSPGGVGS